MKQWKQRSMGLMLAFALLLSLMPAAFASAEKQTVERAAKDTAQYLVNTVKHPAIGTVGGEWTVLGLARMGYAVPQGYYQGYYQRVENAVRGCEGVLASRKYTEYSRVIVGLTAIGADARSVGGYDLTKPLGDFEKTVWQGLNGPIWALIALDSGKYPMPINEDAKVQATRQMYIDHILAAEEPGGGWSLSVSGTADPDITGMALQALAKYQDQKPVREATERALLQMSKMQDGQGGFSTYGDKTVESTAQILVALCELGIPLEDPRFVKNGNSVLDDLMTYYRPGKGFVHMANGSGSSLMATEQGFYALVAAQRAAEGRSSLYRMQDTPAFSPDGLPAAGLAGKHRDVKAVPVTVPGKTFADLEKDAHRTAIEALAARGIINGVTEDSFRPDQDMTRAEFAAIVVRALGLTPKSCNAFADVPPGQWYAPYVGTAYTYGIVNGVSRDRFAPQGTITRQEAALMVSRAAALCGLDTDLDAMAVRDVLAQFSDYVKTPEWSRVGLAVCYHYGILDDSVQEICPKENIRRNEIAEMLYQLLMEAKLL